jgi:N-acetylmuramoyl-L-alanine amidase
VARTRGNSFYIRIHESQVHAFGATGGEVWWLTTRVAMTAVRSAKQRAPKRERKLLASIRANRAVYNAAKRQATSRFYADSTIAPHAQYVIFGVHHRIYPRGNLIISRGGNPVAVMRLPRNPQNFHSPPWMYRTSVRGQSANDFMQKALVAAMVRHGVPPRG